MFFKMVEPSDSPKSFASLRYIKGMPEPLTRALSKQTIVHPTTTVPGLEVSTFARFSDKRRTKNSLYQIFVVLHWRNGRAFQTRKKRTFLKCQNSDQRLNFPGIPKSLTCFLVASGISRVFAHCCSWNVRVSSLWRRAGHRTELSNMAGHCEGYCENCKEMTAYFGTRPGIRGLLSFSATFLCLVIFRCKKEGREAEKHRDEDHSVSQVHARCQIDSKR